MRVEDVPLVVAADTTRDHWLGDAHHSIPSRRILALSQYLYMTLASTVRPISHSIPHIGTSWNNKEEVEKYLFFSLHLPLPNSAFSESIQQSMDERVSLP